jgi:hypothetical protein
LIESQSPAVERISLERDVFTNDDHRPLDVKIVNTFSAFRKHNEEPDSSEPLPQITMDKRLTMLTTDETEELLDQEPSIARISRNRWQVGFKEVQQLGVFSVSFLSRL